MEEAGLAEYLIIAEGVTHEKVLCIRDASEDAIRLAVNVQYWQIEVGGKGVYGCSNG